MLFSSPPSSESVAPQIRFLDFALFFVNTALILVHALTLCLDYCSAILSALSKNPPNHRTLQQVTSSVIHLQVLTDLLPSDLLHPHTPSCALCSPHCSSLQTWTSPFKLDFGLWSCLSPKPVLLLVTVLLMERLGEMLIAWFDVNKGLKCWAHLQYWCYYSPV